MFVGEVALFQDISSTRSGWFWKYPLLGSFGYNIPQTVWTHVATLRGSYGKAQGAVFNRSGIRGVRHFPCKFPHKMALVKGPCAFRLRKLAENDGPGIRVRHFLYKFRHQMALLRCPCAFRLCRVTQTCGSLLGRSIFTFNSRINWLL